MFDWRRVAWVGGIVIVAPIFVGCGVVPVRHTTVIEEGIDGVDRGVTVELLDHTGLVQAIEAGEGGTGLILSVDLIPANPSAFEVVWTACSDSTLIDLTLVGDRYKVVVLEAPPCTTRIAQVRRIVVHLSRPLPADHDVQCAGGDAPTCTFWRGP